jgi:hypothetical protein
MTAYETVKYFFTLYSTTRKSTESSLLIILTLAFGIMLTSTISAASQLVSAQKNQTTTNVAPAGKQATKIINQIPIRPLLQFKRR